MEGALSTRPFIYLVICGWISPEQLRVADCRPASSARRCRDRNAGAIDTARTAAATGAAWVPGPHYAEVVKESRAQLGAVTRGPSHSRGGRGAGHDGGYQRASGAAGAIGAVVAGAALPARRRPSSSLSPQTR